MKSLIHRWCSLSSLDEVELKIKHSGRLHYFMIRNDIMYVDAFSKNWRQFNGEHAIDMGLHNGIRISSSYPQHGWAMHFF